MRFIFHCEPDELYYAIEHALEFVAKFAHHKPGVRHGVVWHNLDTGGAVHCSRTPTGTIVTRVWSADDVNEGKP